MAETIISNFRGYRTIRLATPDAPLLRTSEPTLIEMKQCDDSPVPPHQDQLPLPVLPVFRPEDLLTPSETATFLRVSAKTLANWRLAGSGPLFVKLGGAVRYRFADILQFVMGSVRSSTSDAGES